MNIHSTVHLLVLILGAFLALGVFGYLLRFLTYLATALFYVLNPIYVVTLGPVVYGMRKLLQSRCEKCGRFFAMKREKSEVTHEREVVRSLPVTERGVLYSNRLFTPNQDIEFTHRVETPHIETTVREYWSCAFCGHKKETTGSFEYEGSLDD